MASTTVYPSKNRPYLSGTRWTVSGGPLGQMWDLINNTVETPDDTEDITALATDVDEDFGFDTSAYPDRTASVHTITIQFRYSGLAIDAIPGLLFQLWTDFPTVLARKISEFECNINTAAVIKDGQITFTGLSVTDDEAKAIRCVPITVGGPSGPPPEPFIEI